MAALVNILSGFGILIGLISVIYPLRFIRIQNRRTAAAVLAGAVAVFLVSAVIDGPEHRGQPERQASPASPKSTAELAREVCNVSGSIANCEQVMTKQMADESTRPISAKPAPAETRTHGGCKSDWRQCLDNADLINNFGEITRGEVSCLYAAKKLAKYGTPSFPFLSFSNFRSGNDYVRTGLAVLIEPNAEFQNGFGAVAHTKVTCTYDLASQTVTDIGIAN